MMAPDQKPRMNALGRNNQHIKARLKHSLGSGWGVLK